MVTPFNTTISSFISFSLSTSKPEHSSGYTEYYFIFIFHLSLNVSIPEYYIRMIKLAKARIIIKKEEGTRTTADS